MASEEIDLVLTQRLHNNGLNNPQLVFQQNTPGPNKATTRELTGFIDDKYFQHQGTEFRRNMYGGGRRGIHNWNGRDSNSDGSDGDDDDDVDDGLNKNNSSNTSGHSEKIANNGKMNQLFCFALRSAVQSFRREEELQVHRASKRRRERLEQDKSSYDDLMFIDHPRGGGVQFPFAVTDRVIMKGYKRTPKRFVGRGAVVMTQCLNGWYAMKTLGNAESVKLQYGSLARVPDNPASKPASSSKMTPNWL